VALGTIATAGLARRAAENDFEGLRTTLRQSLSMLAFLTLPATVGLIALGVPVVRLLYERGKFTAADTQATAAALLLYAFGLVGYTGVKVLAPAFYALGRPRVPLAASLLAVATNLAVILVGHGALGYRAIALGTALGSLVNATLLVALFQKRVGGLFGHGLLRPVSGMVLAAVLMGAASRGLSVWLESIVGTSGLLAQLATGLLPVGVGVVLYLAITHALKVGEAHVLLGLLTRRHREA
jgi:putative peptidoglycan lipid II flippase